MNGMRDFSEVIGEDGTPPGEMPPATDDPQSASATPPVEDQPAQQPAPDEGAAKPPEPAQQAKGDDPDDDDGPDPTAFDGAMEALRKARGDKRRARKQWREAEDKLEKARAEQYQLMGRLEMLEKHLQQQPAQKQPDASPEEGKPDPYNVEEYVAWAIKKDREARTQGDEDPFVRKLREGEAYLSAVTTDFPDSIKAFENVANQYPALWQQAKVHPNPAVFIYQQGKRFLEVASSDDDSETLKAENERLKAELEAAKSSQPPRPTIPKTQAGARGSGNGAVGWEGPRNFSDMFPEEIS